MYMYIYIYITVFSISADFGGWFINTIIVLATLKDINPSF